MFWAFSRGWDLSKKSITIYQYSKFRPSSAPMCTYWADQKNSSYVHPAFEILAPCLLGAIVELLTYFTCRVSPTVTYFRIILCVPILGHCFLWLKWCARQILSSFDNGNSPVSQNYIRGNKDWRKKMNPIKYNFNSTSLLWTSAFSSRMMTCRYCWNKGRIIGTLRWSF